MIQNKKPLFILSLRNKKGQIGIFVALIFQVIFVFFAMLVNVGLLIHHKINLQQSTDIAAYYGAMKQAEILNVIAHVNFQIRQSWKLMTWRYRVVGGFGMEPKPSPAGIKGIEFPILWQTGPTNIPNFNALSLTAPDNGCISGVAAGVTYSDVPFMCMGHIGFSEWSDTPSGNETFCKINCADMNNATGVIPRIGNVGGIVVPGANIGASINTAIDTANLNVENVCNKLGPTTFKMLSEFFLSYYIDSQNKKSFIQMLIKNLDLDEDKILDIEGNQIVKGVIQTLKNNLTEANLTAINSNANAIKTYNSAKGVASNNMFKEVAFETLKFFIMNCTYSGGANIKLQSLYDSSGLLIDPTLITEPTNPLLVQAKTIFEINDKTTNTIGFEKNPWYQIYYGVKATSEPKIPFLPLAKIKLTAVSFAKPFGGSIGPWYFKTWDASSENSGNGDFSQRTDMNLPINKASGAPAAASPILKDAIEFIPNYSNYVGDKYAYENQSSDAKKGGLANVRVLAMYNSMLANKFITSTGDSESSKNKDQEPPASANQHKIKPEVWPRFSAWSNIVRDYTDDDYDLLALDLRVPASPKNSYLRDLELSVVAPNQFDSTYYTIDPNFYLNMSKKLADPAVLARMISATGQTANFPYDFGYRKPSKPIDGIPPNFAVRNQMQVVHDIFKGKLADILGPPSNITTTGVGIYGFTFLASLQSSILTSWTFLDFKNFIDFPTPEDNTKPKDSLQFTTNFGTCFDGFNDWSAEFKAPPDDQPAQGNCVSGGRSGYSVKLISSDMVQSGKTFNGLGGPGTSGPLKNTVPADFLTF